MATAHLTAMRQSLWDSIDNYTPLRDVFKKRYLMEGKEALAMQALNPSMKDMPAIAIGGGGGSTPWDTNSMQRWSYNCEIGIWTPHWDLKLGEKLLQLIVQSFEQSVPSGSTRSYVYAACSNVLITGFSRNPQPPADNDVVKTFWLLNVTLQKQWGPGVETATLE